MLTENEDLMRSARASLKDKWGLAIGTFLIYGLLTGVWGSLHSAGSIVSLVIAGPLMLGAASFALSIARGREARLEQIFEGFNDFVRAFVTYLLMVLFVILWSLLLIIPGIIAALGYAMTFYILADDRTIQPMDALSKSKQMMQGHKWKLFGLMMWFLAFAILCILTLGIGFLWFMPFAHVTTAKFYDDIKGSSVINPEP